MMTRIESPEADAEGSIVNGGEGSRHGSEAYEAERGRSASVSQNTSQTDSGTGIVSFSSLDPNKLPLKVCLRVIKAIRRLKDAIPFNQPVDPVLLNIPNYFNVIKNPMDLSKIEKKLTDNQYASTVDFLKDCQLMFENCYTFNGELAPVSIMGRNLQRAVHQKLEKCQSEFDQQQRRKSETSTKPAKTAEMARPKRDVHAPPRDAVSPDKLKTERKRDKTLAFCSQLLRELVSRKYAQYNTPFLFPVDPIAQGVPHYFDIIKNPMDFSTVRKKLEQGEYGSMDEFQEDIRLMFRNCREFNLKGSEVYEMGGKLEKIFDEKWKLRPMGNAGTFGSKGGRKNSSDDDESEAIQPKIMEMAQRIETLQQTLSLLKSTQQQPSKKRKSSIGPGGHDKKSKSKPSGGAKKGGKKRGRDSDDEAIANLPEITYQQKEEISRSITEFDEEYQEKAFDIIRSAMPEINAGGDQVVELDIDTLDKATLYKLLRFVKNAKRNMNKRQKLTNHKKSKVKKTVKGAFLMFSLVLPLLTDFLRIQ
ncbi:Bromodomain-containing protein [Cladochytrium replicatum]|nr:Bromodomain-containing protein [Cladochytrium replicatum]